MNISLKTPIAIVGLGISGESVLSFLLSLGFPRNQIITFDEKSLAAEVSDPKILFSQHKPATLVVSPGVSLQKPWIVAAAQQGVKITSEVNLACSVIKNEVLIGITGSVGKSTVTSLIGSVLSQADKNTFVGGNLGTAFCDYAREVHEKRRSPAPWVVLELSSYQLENCENLHLSVAAIASLTPNHLERYDSLEAYYDRKFHIIDICRGPVILNQDSQDLKVREPRIHQAYPNKKIIWSSSRKTSFDFSQTKLIGQHNRQNLAMAAEVLTQLNIPKEQIENLKEFSGLPHRTEFFGEWDQITFINDSKATSVESVLMAVEACLPLMKPQAKLHLLLGGRDKKLPWEQLTHLQENKNIYFYFFGESKDLIPRKSGLSGLVFESLETGFSSLMKSTKPGDIVLFSPGGTSLDQFKNFEDRGHYFKNLVQNYYSRR